ncbi:hypothetical protein QYE76_035281 [Lolium multiflorum]|uniref:Reverse transcriptase domain-containing protein n=1 Tax=Lolium multiflorum TaxID=4521 RepID=A0AAD8R2L8_LOLMU|nr:hypothetical protein QYE76_035281 [Lolium multiflorum]
MSGNTSKPRSQNEEAREANKDFWEGYEQPRKAAAESPDDEEEGRDAASEGEGRDTASEGEGRDAASEGEGRGAAADTGDDDDTWDDAAQTGEETTGEENAANRTEGDSGGNPQEGKKKRTARRPRRDRRPQVLANVTDAVTVVSESGLPMEPSWVAKGYGMQLGCIVRETVPILTQDLRSKENEAIAQSLLQKLHQRYTFPEPFNKKVDSLALTKMSTALSSWKNRLKRKIEAGESWERISSKDPSLSLEDFNAFKSYLESDTVKKWTAWGKKMRDLNLGTHHCGSGGYRGKQPTWDKEDAEMVRLGKENPWHKIQDEQARNFVRSRYYLDWKTGEFITDHEDVRDFEKYLDEELTKAGPSSQGSTEPWDTPFNRAMNKYKERELATRYVSTRTREKLAKIFNDMSFESSADSYISDGSSDVDSYDFIDKSLTVGKVFINLNDDVTKPNVDLSTKYHQIYAIEDQEETSEAFDSLGNPYVDPSNLRQGLGNKYVGPEPRDRVQLSQAAWDRAARAMNGTEPMATTATPEELQAYQYRLARAARELEKQTAELNRRKEAASASSRRRADLSRQSRTTGDSHREARNRARSRLQHIPEAEREHLVQNLDMSFMSIDTRGNIIPKTPEAGYMATHAFILASKPPPGDPRETLYNMAVAGVGAMGTAFVSTPPEGAARQNSPRPAAATAAAPEGPSGARDTAAQARVDRARQSRRDHRQSPELTDEDMCGLPCFTRRVRKTRVPSGFKLPDNFKKFDGLQDPEDWLVDYLETVKLTGGTRATAMQSIQVHLSGAARSWIKKLAPGSIDSWESFEDVFVKNFRLKEEDEVKTAFITPYGVFCYRTMPFGLKNAGATYQRMMQKCLATQIGKNVQVYIDDVVITSKKGATLIEDLKETFDNLDKFCLKLNPTKCSFGVPAGELWGF